MRNSPGIVKGLVSGAKSMGAAGTILVSPVSKNGLGDTLVLVQQWREEVKMLYILLGKKTTEELTSTALVLDPVLVSQCRNRGIDNTTFVKR